MTLPSINWPDDGLIPVVIQDDDSDTVLMMGYMNAEALEKTRATGQVHYWSRSRQQLWHKGGGSGNVQHVRSMAINCDQNSLLIRVRQEGAVCHDGFASCYYRDVLEDGSLALNQDRLFDPRDVYGDGYGLDALTREWWGAYTWLSDHDLTEHSGTSRLLRDRESSVVGRIRDELVELAGVLDGSHVHTTQRDDAILEASQCCYWIAVESIRNNLMWADVRPDRALDVQVASVNSASASTVLKAETLSLEAITAAVANHLIRVIAEGVRTLDIDPREIIEYDLHELRDRSYLSEYFAE